MYLFLTLILSLNIALNSYSVDQIKNEYEKIFSVVVQNAGDQPNYAIKINSLKKDHFLAGLVNNNKDLIYYLYTYYAPLSQDTLAKYETDKQRQNKYAYQTIKNSSAFNSLFFPLVNNYLKTNKDSLQGYKSPPRDTVSVRFLKSVSVRFFYPYKFDKDGSVKSKILTVNEGLEDLGEKRNPIVEAFGFSALVTNVRDSGLVEDYKNAVKNSFTLSYSNSAATKLKRMQGAVWMQLFENKELENILIKEYKKKSDLLPFVLVREKD